VTKIKGWIDKTGFYLRRNNRSLGLICEEGGDGGGDCENGDNN
jgi:hypothetical protein